MKCFNEQFKKLLALYPNDKSCADALLFLEQDASTPQPSSGEWDKKRVRDFVNGLRYFIKRRNPYFGYLLDNVKIIVVNPKSKTFKTMAVDDKGNLYMNPVFVSKMFGGQISSKYDQNTIDSLKDQDTEYEALKPGEKMIFGVIAHELMHIFKNHIARMGDKTKMVNVGGGPITLWNIATDIEINDELIYKWGYYLPENGIITNPDGSIKLNGKSYDCRNLSPERIYKMLEADIPDAPPDKGGNPPPKPIEVGDIVYDKKQRKYGEVISISKSGEVKIGELTKEEAKSRV